MSNRVIEVEDGEEFLAGLNVDEDTKKDFLLQLDADVNKCIDELEEELAKEQKKARQLKK